MSYSVRYYYDKFFSGIIDNVVIKGVPRKEAEKKALGLLEFAYDDWCT